MQKQPYFSSCALDTSIWGKGGEHSRAQLWKICEGQVYFSILSSLQSAMPSYTTTDSLENLPYCSHQCLPCSPTLEKLEISQQAVVGKRKNQSGGNREATATTLSSQSAFSLRKTELGEERIFDMKSQLQRSWAEHTSFLNWNCISNWKCQWRDLFITKEAVEKSWGRGREKQKLCVD